ncbi:Lrp/AsnC family transcriptional regulator [Cochlodiniinecator piscidefendens]|uniref:Lrp/AsnC family transcriptional regulator n=1 Tax=Cochlodiniinecator piscidefendens TaxID=2715756 RepID=UPI001409EC31|nr:Lrp/AsnC family transcriptional regulator [Cochlodiniinecator piscidefendens]
MPSIDDFDRQLLALLQKNGKLGIQDLAAQTSLSTSPCWRRIRKLEEAGVIDKYVALLDRRALGLNAMAYVHVSLLEHTEETIKAFDSFVARTDEIIECCSITGSNDYMLKVVAPDAEGLEEFLMKDLLALGIVRSSVTNFVLRQKKFTTELPLV